MYLVTDGQQVVLWVGNGLHMNIVAQVNIVNVPHVLYTVRSAYWELYKPYGPNLTTFYKLSSLIMKSQSIPFNVNNKRVFVSH